MITIRLPKAQWAKAWRAMIEVGPVRLIAGDPVYEVMPAHLELLTTQGFSYEVVPIRQGRSEGSGRRDRGLTPLRSSVDSSRVKRTTALRSD